MTSDNKRKHERIDTLNLSYICLDEDENIVKQGMGRTLNLSLAGILLETHFRIESDHRVQLTISLEEELMDLKGKAVHVKSCGGGKYQIGIEFIDLDKKSADIMQKFIESNDIAESSKVLKDK
ncbi:hypothetical protein D1AOALGA4SA_7772 [Olavius algarvensis Delta 1 endosymbiont]|nr:hypothetical protein D1AOALGA4SA_7772 [Olavius algarvensis Delta 1 endosymbiont]